MVEAKYILSFVSLIVLGYIFLINHFLRDLDDFCHLLDECGTALDKPQTDLDDLNYKEVYFKLRRVQRSIFPVSFGISGILTLIIFFLIWITGILGTCTDLREFWWIPIPIILITLFFLQQFLDHIHDIYNVKYRNCRTLFRNYITHHIGLISLNLPEHFPSGNTNLDSFWRPREPDFLQIGELKNSLLRGWRYFWWITLVWGAGTLVLLVLGIGDTIFYQFAILSFILAFLIPLVCYIICCICNRNHSINWGLFGKYLLIWGVASVVGIFVIILYDFIQEVLLVFINSLFM